LFLFLPQNRQITDKLPRVQFTTGEKIPPTYLVFWFVGWPYRVFPCPPASGVTTIWSSRGARWDGRDMVNWQDLVDSTASLVAENASSTSSGKCTEFGRWKPGAVILAAPGKEVQADSDTATWSAIRTAAKCSEMLLVMNQCIGRKLRPVRRASFSAVRWWSSPGNRAGIFAKA
jgi:hypothetical protein